MKPCCVRKIIADAMRYPEAWFVTVGLRCGTRFEEAAFIRHDEQNQVMVIKVGLDIAPVHIDTEAISFLQIHEY